MPDPVQVDWRTDTLSAEVCKLLEERFPAEWTGGLVAGSEPFVLWKAEVMCYSYTNKLQLVTRALCYVYFKYQCNAHISHQTCWVEFLFAGAAGLLGERVVGAVNNREADHTVLYSFEALIHIVLPKSQALHYTTILSTQTHNYIFSFSLLIPKKKHLHNTP